MSDESEASYEYGEALCREFESKPPLHPAIEHILQFFVFNHLPEPARFVSGRFAELAMQTAHNAPYNPETTHALRKLLEAKDCAVRAVISSKDPLNVTEEDETRIREQNP